ncbi:MAG: hypothetical protein K0U98_06330 [Deltaproteobacteria bacterium]|nr:hypothetical protein [Deltaproteobacteria bacterium]
MQAPYCLRPHEIAKNVPKILAVIAVFLLPVSMEAMHPNHRLGIDPNQSFESGVEGIDQVDLYSGSLSLGIPIGPFSLLYSSNVWQYLVDDSTGDITARPFWERTGGLGFHLGWGEIYQPNYILNETNKWLYVDRQGSRHTFYPTLHKDDGDDGDATANKVHYSRDGSYLRLTLSNDSCRAYVEEPDGTTRLFVGSCGPQTTYRLTKVWSPYASEADPDVTITYGTDPADPDGTEDTLRTVTNRYGLTHKVFLSDKIGSSSISWVRRIVTRVELESFAGQKAIFDFHYRQIPISVSCKDTSSITPGTISVPHLERIDMPDGTAYTFTEGSSLLYESACRSIDGKTVDDLPGVLTGVNLPTGGKIRWDYQRYELPPGHTASVFYTSAGIKSRRLLKADGSEFGLWTYKSTRVPTTGSGDDVTDPEMHTEVVYPTGHCSKHFFDAIYWVDPVTPTGPRGWELGLPFVYSEESGGKYLSSQVYTGNDGNRSCDPTTKLRSTYVRYRHDPTPGQAPTPPNGVVLDDFYNTNRQPEASRTVFHDDGDWYIETEFSDFDGLGNFRRKVESSNLSGIQTRETTVGFYRSSGTYPGNYSVLPISQPWILGVFDFIEVHDPGAVGVQTHRTEYGFEDSTGFLSCTRVLAGSGGRGSKDVLTVQNRDDLGRVLDSKLYGGDLQLLSTLGGACGLVPAQPVYWTSHEYDPLSGGRVRSWPRHPDGSYGSFPTSDVDIEPRTGFLLHQRDPAGYQVTTSYDSIGRLLTVSPQSGAVTHITYVNPTAGAPGKVTTVKKPAEGGAPLVESEVIVDDFGRPTLERRKLPGGIWSERETRYNSRGWVESVSQWGNLAKKTLMLDFDPFGRPTTIRPADGASHDVTISYRGERVVTETAKVALGGGESAVSRISLLDGFGRLTRLWESSGPAGGTHRTDYSYDAAGRLTELKAGPQTRVFSYDGRGFLLAETHPEKGVNGGGTVTYHEYDAGGLVHHRIDGPNDLGFSYDFMGRPLEISDRSRSRLVSRMQWDSAPGSAVGKLHYADRYNYVDLPWNGTAEEEVRVRQLYKYKAANGAVSEKVTRVFWSSPDVRFRQNFGYDQLGNVLWVKYPGCDIPSACKSSEVGTKPFYNYSYDQGLLTRVGGWADQITYHPSGLWKQIDHTNGVSDHQDADPSIATRPQRLFTTGVSPSFDSGLMSYDGAGNLKAMGADSFAYDGVGRLVDADYSSTGLSQSYSYDRHGNLTSLAGDTVGMVIPPVDAATNRLVGANYDGAGNLLTAPWPLPAAPFRYDTQNLLTGQAWLSYLYDAFGERIVSFVNAPVEAPIFHLRDLGNRMVSQIRNNEGVWSREKSYVFAGNRLLGRDGPGAADLHFHLDHLKSVRLSTTPSGDFAGESFFLPYGERILGGSTADSLLFAEPHERDFSTGTDYMHARHYWWKLGRFQSVDPLGGFGDRPQSLNRYAYAMGNPINMVDPTGERGQCNNGEDSNSGICNPPGFSETITVYAYPKGGSGSTFLEWLTRSGFGCGDGSCGFGVLDWTWAGSPADIGRQRPGFRGIDFGGIPNGTKGPRTDLVEDIQTGSEILAGVVVAASSGVAQYLVKPWAENAAKTKLITLAGETRLAAQSVKLRFVVPEASLIRIRDIRATAGRLTARAATAGQVARVATLGGGAAVVGGALIEAFFYGNTLYHNHQMRGLVNETREQWIQNTRVEAFKAQANARNRAAAWEIGRLGGLP